MKKEGYAIECEKCNSYNISKSEPIIDAQTNIIYQTLICNDCGEQERVER